MVILERWLPAEEKEQEGCYDVDVSDDFNTSHPAVVIYPDCYENVTSLRDTQFITG